MPPVSALRPIHAALRSLDPGAPPEARVICGPVTAPRRLVALAGSFNPPHRAHLALLHAGLAAAQADAGAFVLSVRTVDKEQVTGMLLEDRLWLLCRLIAPSPPTPTSPEELSPLPGAPDQALGVVAVNRGLYVEQAEALRRLWPGLDDLTFVVGFDKIVQIFDPRYYADRDQALARLFEQARFLVAPRDEHGLADIERLLAEPPNRSFAARVQPLPVPLSIASISSTALRQWFSDEAARSPGLRVDEWLPALVRQFIEQSGCYGPPERRAAYARRALLLAG